MGEGCTVVTGAAGFIARHAVSALRACGVEVAPVDNLCVPPLQPPVDGTLIRDVAELRPADLSGARCVLHLAAWRSVPDSFGEPLRYQHNIAAALHLLTLARECGVRRIVLASSCEVYGMSAKVPTSEDATLAPRSPYALSKASVEMLARMHDWSDALDITVARLFNVYGPSHRPDTVIASFCRSVVAGKPLMVHGAGQQRRDFSHVSATVEKLIRLTEIPSPPPVVNIGSGASTSVLDLIALFQRVQPSLKVEHVDARPCEIAEFRADTELAEASLGHVPEMLLEDGIRTTLDWWRSYTP